MKFGLTEIESLEEKEKILSFAYSLLKANGQPIHYSVLLDEITNKFYTGSEALLDAKVRFYTWLNLDARFTNTGQGCWGLRATTPQKGSRQVPLLTLMHKTVEYDDSPAARVAVRDDLDDETLSDKEVLEDDEGDADGDDQDEFDEEIDPSLEEE